MALLCVSRLLPNPLHCVCVSADAQCAVHRKMLLWQPQLVLRDTIAEAFYKVIALFRVSGLSRGNTESWFGIDSLPGLILST